VRLLRILFHNCRILHPLNGGDRIRTFNMLKELRKAHELTYLCLRTPADSDEAVALANEYCHEVIPVPHAVKNKRGPRFYAEVLGNTLFGKYPFLASKYVSAETVGHLERLIVSGRFDLIICDYLAPMGNLLELGARPRLPMMLFQHNVESVIFKRHSETASNPLKRALYRRQWKAVERLERQAAAFVDTQVAVSESDVVLFREMGMTNVLGAVPTGVDCEFFQPPAQRASRPVMAFLGAMDWDANQDAVRWFAGEILPRIRAAVPDAEFLGIGRNPPASLRALAENDPRIRLTGTVPDVRPHMADAAVMILPLRVGGGTRIKVYEAMAMGTPVVSTSIGVEGLDYEHGKNVVIADNADDFATSVIQLLQNPERAAAMAADARLHVAANYSWSVVAGIFSRYCAETVDAAGRRAV
jgi:glycosyltransferase involved in cell wall biosynthesis